MGSAAPGWRRESPVLRRKSACPQFRFSDHQLKLLRLFKAGFREVPSSFPVLHSAKLPRLRPGMEIDSGDAALHPFMVTARSRKYEDSLDMTQDTAKRPGGDEEVQRVFGERAQHRGVV